MSTVDFLLLWGSALAAAAAATWAVRAVAVRCGLVNQPNPIVPQHTRPVAHLGGIAVAAATAAAWLLGNLLSGPSVGFASPPVAVGALSFLLLGVADDLWRFSARRKLACQLVLAVVSVMLGVRHAFTGVAFLDDALSVAWMVTLVNCVNVTDVCDGLVTGISAIAFSCYGLLPHAAAPMACILSGACIGFLLFNFPPASIFLGDTGSHFLGYCLAAILLMHGEPSGGWLWPAQMILLAAPFLFEMVLLVVERRRKGLAWYHGSPDHFSLRLQNAGLTRFQTDLVAWMAALFSGGCAIALADAPPVGRGAILLVAALATCAGWHAIRRLPAPQRRASPPRPRRILWIHQNFVTARQAGNSRPVHIVAAWLERGWQVDIITSQAGYLDAQPATGGPDVVIEREGLLSIHRLRHAGDYSQRGKAWVSFSWRALWYAWRLGPVDLVYASTPPPLQLLLAVFASVWNRAPMVLEVRDLWPAALIRTNLLRSRTIIVALQWMESLACRFCTHCVSVSPAFMDYLAGMGLGPDRATAVPSGGRGAPAESDGQLGESWRRQHGLDSAPMVLYAGSFNEMYAIARLLDAARTSVSRRADVVWVFAGNGRMQEQVRAAARQCSSIRYLGSVPKDELAGAYAAADLAVVSLADEPLLKLCVPGKELDYLAGGLPLISTADGLAGAILRRARAGMVLSQPSPEQLADAVLSCLALPPDELAQMGSRGQAWVLGHMNASQTGRRVARVVAATLETGPGRSQLLALAAALLGGICDVLTRRGGRVMQRLLERDLDLLAAERFDQWLQKEAPDPDDCDRRPLELPGILSSAEGPSSRRNAEAAPVQGGERPG